MTAQLHIWSQEHPAVVVEYAGDSVWAKQSWYWSAKTKFETLSRTLRRWTCYLGSLDTPAGGKQHRAASPLYWEAAGFIYWQIRDLHCALTAADGSLLLSSSYCALFSITPLIAWKTGRKMDSPLHDHPHNIMTQVFLRCFLFFPFTCLINCLEQTSDGSFPLAPSWSATRCPSTNNTHFTIP